MNNDELLSKIKNYEERILYLENELNQTKEHLKKYTAPSNMKKYYENHKEEIKQKVKEYKEKTNYVVPKEVIKEIDCTEFYTDSKRDSLWTKGTTKKDNP